jgi:hypothetical protein
MLNLEGFMNVRDLKQPEVECVGDRPSNVMATWVPLVEGNRAPPVYVRLLTSG